MSVSVSTSRKRDGAQIRKERLNELMTLIENHPTEDEFTIKGMFMLRTGLTIEKIEQYLTELETFKLIHRENGYLKLK